MKLHPDVLTDLTILYHAGEASQASRAILEDAAKSDARLAAALSAPPPARQLPGGAPDVQRRAISDLESKTKRRGSLFGLAIFLTLLPFSIVVRKGEITFFLLRDVPILALGLFTAGLSLAVATMRMYRLR